MKEELVEILRTFADRISVGEYWPSNEALEETIEKIEKLFNPPL